MNTELAIAPNPSGLATAQDAESIEKIYTLVKNTINGDLNPEEFQLFMHDCKRQGVHPLDRLIHPTIRTDRKTGIRKYTAITSIDLFRIRAEATGELAGNDDPVFSSASPGPSFEAKVTVWRMVQGTRCPFTATARWNEYKPPPPNDFMWNTKPHVMLGKCAEALALRKAFPKQLGTMYIREEMEQAGPATHEPLVVVETPTGTASARGVGAVVIDLPPIQDPHSEKKANGYMPEKEPELTDPPTPEEAAEMERIEKEKDAKKAQEEKRKAISNPDIPQDAQVMMVEVMTFNSTPRPVGTNGSLSYSIKVKLEDGEEKWTSTFHKDQWEYAKILKGQKAKLTCKYKGQYLNFFHIEEA